MQDLGALDVVADTVLTRGAARVGVDGVDGVGKTRFADDLAAVLRGARRHRRPAGVDDWHRPRAVRYRRGRESAEGFWLDSYQYERMRAELLQPFGPGGDRRHRTAVHDLSSDGAVDAPFERAGPDAVLVVDGIFLRRPELDGCFDLVVFLDAPFTATYARMSFRDGSPADPDDPANRRYREGQELYLTSCRPRERADLLVDLTDVACPRLVRPLA